MPDSKLLSSFGSQCRKAIKLKCTDQLQPGYSKRPNNQLGQEQLPPFHGNTKIPPSNKPVGTLQINGPTITLPGQVIDSSISSLPRTNKYVFKRRSKNPEPNYSTSTCSTVSEENKFSEQLQSANHMNIDLDSTTVSEFSAGQLNGLVYVQPGLQPPVPALIPLQCQPVNVILTTHPRSSVVLSEDSIICCDGILGQQSKVSNSTTSKLMPHPSTGRSQSKFDTLQLSDQCTNFSSTKLGCISHQPLAIEVKKGYTFKKIIPATHSSQNSVLHSIDVKAVLSNAVDDKLLENQPNFNLRHASVTQKSHPANVCDAEESCLQVSSSSSSITDSYEALHYSNISSKVFNQTKVVKDNPVHLESQVSKTFDTAPISLNHCRATSGVANNSIETSPKESCGSIGFSYGSTRSASNSSANVAGLVCGSALNEPFVNIDEPAVCLQSAYPKVTKKAAQSKRQKKPSKRSTEAVMSTNDATFATSSDTIKMSAIKKKVPKQASAKASKSAKDSTKVVKASSSSSDVPEVEADPLVVYFDLETTGLSYSHEITQISCVCPDVSEGGIFNVYTLPKGVFNRMASQITGLSKHGQSLYLYGEKVPTISLQEGLMQLVQWLEALPRRPLLVGHNSRKFDCPRLALALWNNNSFDLIKKRICGFSDSLPVLRTLLPSRCEYKLESLLHEYCPKSTESSHNALDDCIALQSVLQEVVKRNLKSKAAAASGNPGRVAAPVVVTTTPTAAPESDIQVPATPMPNVAGDLIRETLNECLLKEFFSIEKVVENMRFSATAHVLMKVNGS